MNIVFSDRSQAKFRIVDVVLVAIIFFVPVRSQVPQPCTLTGELCTMNNRCCNVADSCHEGICRTCSFWSCTVDENCCVHGDHCHLGLCQGCVLSNQSCIIIDGCCLHEETCLRGLCKPLVALGQRCEFDEQCVNVQRPDFICENGICSSCSREQGPCDSPLDCCNAGDLCFQGICRNDCCPTGQGEECLFKAICCDPTNVWRWDLNGVKRCVPSS